MHFPPSVRRHQTPRTYPWMEGAGRSHTRLATQILPMHVAYICRVTTPTIATTIPYLRGADQSEKATTRGGSGVADAHKR